MAKEFHLGDVLSVTTGFLVSPSQMDGVFNILNFMTNNDLYLNELPMVAGRCGPNLLKQFPQLESIDISDINEENYAQWLAKQIAQYGEKLAVEKL